MGNWVPIVEYSAKTGISVSTIRRKIKAKKLKHKIENNKYFIFEGEDNNSVIVEAVSSNDKNGRNNNEYSPTKEELLAFAEKSIAMLTKFHQENLEEKERRLTLQEQLIKQLREEIEELRMLVKVLETQR